MNRARNRHGRFVVYNPTQAALDAVGYRLWQPLFAVVVDQAVESDGSIQDVTSTYGVFGPNPVTRMTGGGDQRIGPNVGGSIGHFHRQLRSRRSIGRVVKYFPTVAERTAFSVPDAPWLPARVGFEQAGNTYALLVLLPDGTFQGLSNISAGGTDGHFEWSRVPLALEAS